MNQQQLNRIRSTDTKLYTATANRAKVKLKEERENRVRTTPLKRKSGDQAEDD